MDRKIHIKMVLDLTVITDKENISDIIDDIDIEAYGTDQIVEDHEILTDQCEITDAR